MSPVSFQCGASGLRSYAGIIERPLGRPDYHLGQTHANPALPGLSCLTVPGQDGLTTQPSAREAGGRFEPLRKSQSQREAFMQCADILLLGSQLAKNELQYYQMIKYAHIGYPKAASSWLQSAVFPVHPELHHLGRSGGDKIVDDEIRSFLWRDVHFRPEFLWDAEPVKKVLKLECERAEALGKKACGISQEGFIGSAIGCVDPTIRARRLREVLGSDTKIVMVVREQLSWIKSAYSSMVRELGWFGGFDEFVSFFFYDRDRSMLSSFYYDRMYELYVSLFGRDNVTVIAFEQLVRDSQRFVDDVCEAIGVSTFDVPGLPPANESITPEQLYLCEARNRKKRYYLGGAYQDWPYIHAIIGLYECDYGVSPPPRAARGASDWRFAFGGLQKVMPRSAGRQLADLKRVFDHRELLGFSLGDCLGYAREWLRNGRACPRIEVAFLPDVEARLAHEYAPHNRRLMLLAGIDLSAFGYHGCP